MNYMPKLDRRSFLAGSATGRACRFGFHVPFDDLRRARRGAPEINAWVVIKPRRHTVVIRIARSEMGQGTLTGLAQMRRRGARMRLVEGDDRVSDARRERCAQDAPGASSRHRRQPRHPHSRRSMCARAARPRA